MKQSKPQKSSAKKCLTSFQGLTAKKYPLLHSSQSAGIPRGGKIAFGDLTATDILTAGLSDHAVFLAAHNL
jgi:hypothetical protein